VVAGFDSAVDNVAGRQRKKSQTDRFEWVQVALFGFVVIKDAGDLSMGAALEASGEEAGDAVWEMVEGYYGWRT